MRAAHLARRDVTSRPAPYTVTSLPGWFSRVGAGRGRGVRTKGPAPPHAGPGVRPSWPHLELIHAPPERGVGRAEPAGGPGRRLSPPPTGPAAPGRSRARRAAPAPAVAVPGTPEPAPPRSPIAASPGRDPPPGQPSSQVSLRGAGGRLAGRGPGAPEVLGFGCSWAHREVYRRTHELGIWRGGNRSLQEQECSHDGAPWGPPMRPPRRSRRPPPPLHPLRPLSWP